jgi:glycine cleavage system H lipoate-binding protein
MGSDPVFTSYDIEIAKNSDFTDIISRDRRTVNFSEITRGLDEGQYYWRVQGNISETEKVPFSEAGNFAVTVKEVLTLVSPSSGEEIKIPADRKDNRIRLLWKKLSLPGTYKVQLADNPEFAKSRIINFSNANEGEISIPESGEYYWRVTLADKKGIEVMRSETGKFTAVVEKPAEVVKTLLVVKAPVQGARIYINSAFRGYSSVSVEVRPELNLNVKITAQNFKEYTATVKVEEGKTYTLAPTMERTKMLERVKWVSSFSSPLSSAPVYYKDRIITCSENGTFTVLNSSGTVIVQKKIASRIESRPVVHENNVYIVDVDGNLYSIEINSGKLNWKVKAGGPLLFRSEPLVTPDSIFLATGFELLKPMSIPGRKNGQMILTKLYTTLCRLLAGT